jgi:hypothetical protein
MNKLNIVEFPTMPAAQSLPEALRKLANEIEQGEYGDSHNLAWAIDCGDSRIELDYLGKCSEPAAAAHFLFALAMRRLESGALGQ